jgi:type I restriction enzyme S subunit
MTWHEVSLKQICDADWGNTKLTKSAYVANGKFLAVSAAGADGLIDHFEHEADVPVLSAIGAQCGRMFYPGERFTAIKNTITLTPKVNMVNGKFLYYLFTHVELPQRGAGQPFISKGDIEAFKVFIPASLEEQRQIVKMLDSAFAEIDYIGEGITTRIKNASELFAEICLAKTQDLKPAGFKSLKEIATVITKGTTPTSLGYKFTSSGINFLKVESLDENGGFIENKFAFIDSDCHESLKRSQLAESDVLVSIAGALGRTAIVTADVCPANVNQALSLIRLPKDAEISPNFLIALFQSGYFKLDLDRMGAGAAQQNLSLAQIGSLKVPIFSEPKQKEFIDFLYNLRGLITELKDQLETQYLLKSELQKSILTKTFFNSTDNELVA